MLNEPKEYSLKKESTRYPSQARLPIGVYNYERFAPKGRRSEFSNYFSASGMYEDTSINAATLKETKFRLKMKKLKELKKEEISRQYKILQAKEYIKSQKEFKSASNLPGYLLHYSKDDINELLKLNKLCEKHKISKSYVDMSSIDGLDPKDIIKIKIIIASIIIQKRWRGIMIRKRYPLKRMIHNIDIDDIKSKDNEDLDDVMDENITSKQLKALLIIQKHAKGYLLRK